MNNLQRLVAIALILSIIIVPGCISKGPEDAIASFIEHTDRGEYEQALDLLVHPSTMEPYSEKEKYMYRSIMEQTYGKDGENIKFLEMKVVDKEEIDEDTYVITVYTRVFYENEIREDTRSYTVVKIDGEWKIAEEIPGFGALFSLAGLLSAGILIRRRHSRNYIDN